MGHVGRSRLTDPAAKALRKEDAKKNTQKRVGMLLGVDQRTVSLWFTKPTTNTSAGIGSKPKPSQPDARVKVSAAGKAKADEQKKFYCKIG